MTEVTELKEEIKDLSKRLQYAETSIKIAEVTRSERHQSMIDRFERVEDRLNQLDQQLSMDMNKLYKKIDSLQDLAIQGKTSLKTLWVVGSIVAGGMALLASWLQLFK
jgi:predicted  nucleic acid-binding Zn-ribbon protein